MIFAAGAYWMVGYTFDFVYFIKFGKLYIDI